MSSESEKIRAERKRQRELKNARKEELSGATSASERRKIKAKYSEPKANVNEGRSEGNSYDSMSGRTEQPMPTMSEREAESGLYDTTVGRDSFYDSDIEPSAPESPFSNHLYPDGDGGGFSNATTSPSGGGGGTAGGGGGGGGGGDGEFNTLDVIICVDGEPQTVTFLTP